MVLIVLFGLFALSCAAPLTGNKSQEIYPNCDLIAVAYLNVYPKSDNRLNIDFAWDRKNENYEKLDGQINYYFVRHGPLVDGKLGENARVFFAEVAKEDHLSLVNVQPSKDYGIQICGMTEEKADDDIWQHAWMGHFNMSDEDKYYRKQKIDYNSFLPRCNLVDTSFVGAFPNGTSHTLTVSLSWLKKEASYQQVKSIDHYRIRHGRQEKWGMLIKEQDAQYFDAPGNETEITLPNVQYGSFWGVQICAIQNQENDDDEINWDKEAWLGSMDYTSYRSVKADDDGPLYEPFGGPIEDK